jgi:hypothetical protein
MATTDRDAGTCRLISADRDADDADHIGRDAPGSCRSSHRTS